uniref:DBF4 zinc finger B n=2 Tax=Canis lupus familiaris TaxID=9615 RepID=A0A8P0TIQ9_CANLF
MELSLAVPGSRAGDCAGIARQGQGMVEGRRLMMKVVLLLFCPFSGDGRLSELQSSMADSSLRAPDLGTQLGVSASLKKCRKTSTDAGRQPFSGKSFYLDLPAGKSLQFLTGAIQQLGGVIEGFLSKEVSYIVSSRREAKAESNGTSPRGCPSPSEVRGQTPSIVHPKDGHTRPSQKPADSVRTSSGKKGMFSEQRK